MTKGGLHRTVLPRGRRGFTLIEMVAVIWGLGILMLIGAVSLIAALKLQNAATSYPQRLALHAAAADEFRADVARASAAPDAAGKFKAGPNCVILRVAADTFVVYRWEGGQLERFEMDGARLSRRVVAVAKETLAVRFVREDGKGRVLAMRLDFTQAGGERRGETIVESALGGDLR